MTGKETQEKLERGLERARKQAEKTGELDKVARINWAIEHLPEPDALAIFTSAATTNPAIGTKRAAADGGRARAVSFKPRNDHVRRLAAPIEDEHPDWPKTRIIQKLRQQLKKEGDKKTAELSVRQLRDIVWPKI